MKNGFLTIIIFAIIITFSLLIYKVAFADDFVLASMLWERKEFVEKGDLNGDGKVDLLDHAAWCDIYQRIKRINHDVNAGFAADNQNITKTAKPLEIKTDINTVPIEVITDYYLTHDANGNLITSNNQ